MTDIRLTQSPAAAARTVVRQTVQTTSEPVTEAKAELKSDSFKSQGLPLAGGAKIIAEALQFPDKPKNAQDMPAWLMDAYSRLLTAETTMTALRKSSDKDDFRTISQLQSKLWNAQREIAKLDKDDAVKAEFFQTIIPPAQELIDSLASYPEPPADAAGKAEWLANAKQELAKAKAADEIMRMAWFNFKALDFDARSDASSKLFSFESRVRQVEYELNPPAPRAAASGPKASGTPGPIFSNTQGAANLANSKNPVSQVAGAVAMPFAVTLDVIDLITRPIRWLDSVSPKR